MMNEREMLGLLLQKVDGMGTDMASLKTDVADLKTDVAGLKTDVADLKTDVAGLKTDVADLKTDVADLKERMVRVEITQENVVTPQLKLLAEGQKEIKEQIRSLSVIDRMQDDIFVLKAAVRQLSSELENLKSAM